MHSGSWLEDSPGPLEGYSVSRLSVCRPSTQAPHRGQQCHGRLRRGMGSCGVQELMNGFSALIQGPHGTSSSLLLHGVTVSSSYGPVPVAPPRTRPCWHRSHAGSPMPDCKKINACCF